ncbi:hypothetical protein BS78_03G320000 [Paspalum vaginatum]|nr:hypothetical protein BS78_03G320000 [Paspalum vaginatum]
MMIGTQEPAKPFPSLCALLAAGANMICVQQTGFPLHGTDSPRYATPRHATLAGAGSADGWLVPGKLPARRAGGALGARVPFRAAAGCRPARGFFLAFLDHVACFLCACAPRGSSSLRSFSGSNLLQNLASLHVDERFRGAVPGRWVHGPRRSVLQRHVKKLRFGVKMNLSREGHRWNHSIQSESSSHQNFPLTRAAWKRDSFNGGSHGLT